MHKGLTTSAALATAALACAFSFPAQAFPQNAELGQPFLHAEANHHQNNYTPDLAIDGSRSGTSRWQGQSGSHLTLDVGTTVDMAGVYVWLLGSSNRNYWLRVESSQDGEHWVSHWHGIATPRNANSKPVFLPLVTEQKSARYIRVTGFGNTIRNKNYVTEVRWLPEGTAVSSNRHVKQAHWFNTGTSDDQKHYAPNLSSWSTDATNLLSATTRSNSHSGAGCPLNWLSIFNPQYVVSDMTGQMTQFMTTKNLPDGSSIWAIDWDHIDLSRPEDWNGEQDELDYPMELNAVYKQWAQRVNELGSTIPLRNVETTCFIDIHGWGNHAPNQLAFFKYLANSSTGEYQDEILEHWDQDVAINSDFPNNFEQVVTLGEAFTTQTVDSEGEGISKATDGFIDPGSRWSSSPDQPSWTRFAHLSVGPAVTGKPKAKGLYIWMHRSSERWSKLKISARTDGGEWTALAQEITLPQVPDSTPVYIALPAPETHDFKHFLIEGLGSQGSDWTSVAEIRYSATAEPDPSAVVVDPSLTTPHPVMGYIFDHAGTGHISGEQTNTPSFTIDGSVEPLNYWAFKGTGALNLSLDAPKLISAINLWMHRSSERSSIVDISVSDSSGLLQYNIDNADIPITPDDQATRIEFDKPVLSSQIQLSFHGNSVNDWNSISEVSWQ